MQRDDMGDDILVRFETRLAGRDDVSAQTVEVLSGSDTDRDFGDDEQLLEALTGLDNK